MKRSIFCSGDEHKGTNDTEIRGYNMPSIPHCTEGSPADDSLCSPAMPFSLCGTCQSPAPEPSQGPIRPSDSHPNQQIPQHRVNLQSSLVSARTRDPPAPKRKVSFAPGPGDSHPVSSQVARSVSNPYAPIAYHPTEALTRHNLAAMENELGEEFKAENAASLVRLRRRLGIIPMFPIPRPYVTDPKPNQGAS